jgi:hypothetical protein
LTEGVTQKGSLSLVMVQVQALSWYIGKSVYHKGKGAMGKSVRMNSGDPTLTRKAS